MNKTRRVTRVLYETRFSVLINFLLNRQVYMINITKFPSSRKILRETPCYAVSFDFHKKATNQCARYRYFILITAHQRRLRKLRHNKKVKTIDIFQCKIFRVAISDYTSHYHQKCYFANIILSILYFNISFVDVISF